MSVPREMPTPDLLIIAANARSLIANRGDLIREIRESGRKVEAAVPEADFLEEVHGLGIPVHKIRLRRPKGFRLRPSVVILSEAQA